MTAQLFLREILSKSLTVASDQSATLSARASMARLALHILDELGEELTEADVTAVLGALDVVLHDDRAGGIAIMLARGLWLVTPEADDARLFAAFRRLAARAFERGDRTEGFTTIVELLGVLGAGQLLPPEAWGEAALHERSHLPPNYTARLITRWVTGFQSTPQWLREALRDPRVVSGLPPETLLRILAATPSVVVWRSLARRRCPIVFPSFRRPTEVYEALELAIVEETDETACDRLTAWLSDVVEQFGV